MLLYFVFVLGIGFALKRFMKTSKDFFQAGRALPAWICGLAFISANLGAQEVIGMGASGAKYGLETAHFYGIGAIPAMIFVGIFMMPFYYGSKARSVPEFLRLRFDEKTRALNACSFAVMTVFSSGISMYAMARLIQALHVFDHLFLVMGWPLGWIFTFSIVLSAIIVLLYIFLGGLTSAIYNEVLQFFLIIAGFLPLVLIGLKSVGGWQGMKTAVASIDPRMLHEWKGIMHPATNPMGIDIIGLAMGLGFVLGSGYWCTDFLVIQTAMASHNMDAARKVPLIAALPKMIFPFLVILPGLLAISIATPHTTTTVSMQGGAIIHETNIVPPEVEQGRGLVPAKVNPVTGKPMLDASGKPLLDYDMATPNMLLHFFPTGILGLGLTALLASFMSGMAGNVTAFNTVFTYDLYQSYIHKNASDKHYLAVGRWATVGGILLSICTAYAAINFNNIMDTLQLVFSFVNAPLFATFLLGMFWKRTTGDGAFIGLISGTLAAVLHHGLSLPLEAHPGIHGGWIHVLHTYPSDMAQNFYTAIWAFSANLIITILVSLMGKPKPEAELVGLVHSLTPKPDTGHATWWRRPEALAVLLVVLLVVLNIFFF
ncbi:sodium:solute symporter family protein [Acidicapsa dinghuensis]|uniref:Sodium:solute symporter family protein n=1 Tax=Acidicapsa dinghuensis TaxID=2218256 RepID=A0ABW1EQN4_9BACT